MSPFVTNLNAATAIILVDATTRVGTSLDNASPNFIDASMRLAVRYVSCKKDFKLVASARENGARAKMIVDSSMGIATIALTQPNNLISVVFGNWAKSDKPIESLPANVFREARKGDILGLHKKLPFLCQVPDRYQRCWDNFISWCYSFILAYLVEKSNAVRGLLWHQAALLGDSYLSGRKIGIAIGEYHKLF